MCSEFPLKVNKKPAFNKFYLISFALLYNCLSYLDLIGQLDGNIFPYCSHVITCAYSDAMLLPVPIEVRKLYHKYIIATSLVGQ